MADQRSRIVSSSNARVSEEDIIVEEFENELNDALIPEEALHYLLDTARRLKINGEIHQISEAGTFIYTEDVQVEFDSLYANFLDRYMSYSNRLDSFLCIWINQIY